MVRRPTGVGRTDTTISGAQHAVCMLALVFSMQSLFVVNPASIEAQQPVLNEFGSVLCYCFFFGWWFRLSQVCCHPTWFPPSTTPAVLRPRLKCFRRSHARARVDPDPAPQCRLVWTARRQLALADLQPCRPGHGPKGPPALVMVDSTRPRPAIAFDRADQPQVALIFRRRRASS
jgi:hypothetical protein